MRAIFIFLTLATFMITGCASVEVAKEMGKATKSIETSVKKMIKSINEEKEQDTKKEIEEQEEQEK